MFEPLLLWPLDDAEMSRYGSIPSFLETSLEGLDSTLSMSNNFQARTPTDNYALSPISPVAEDSASRHGRILAGLPETRESSPGTQPPFLANQCHLNEFSDGTELTEIERDILISEDYGHVPNISASLYQNLQGLYAHLFQGSLDTPRPRIPRLEVLNAFVQAYFEHFHKGFPLVHQGTFQPRKESLVLVLAIAALGSQYSRFPRREVFRTALLKIIRHAFQFVVNSPVSFLYLCVQPVNVQISLHQLPRSNPIYSLRKRCYSSILLLSLMESVKVSYTSNIPGTCWSLSVVLYLSPVLFSSGAA